jgi:hypothetical protein
MTIVYRGRTRDYEWDDDQWSEAVNYALHRAGMVTTAARRYSVRPASTPDRDVSIAWVGLAHDGREIRFTAHEVDSLRIQIPQHWKAFKYFNGRSLEVGGARLVRIRDGATEPQKRGWEDLVDRFTELRTEDSTDESTEIHSSPAR